MFGEAAIRRIENLIFFMNATTRRTDRLASQTFQDALEGFEVGDFEFNFGFVRHGIPSLRGIGE